MQVTKLVYCLIPTTLCDFYIFANKKDWEKIVAFKIFYCLLFCTYKLKKKRLSTLCRSESVVMGNQNILLQCYFLKTDKTQRKSEKCPVAKRSSKGGGSEAGPISVGTMSSCKEVTEPRDSMGRLYSLRWPLGLSEQLSHSPSSSSLPSSSFPPCPLLLLSNLYWELGSIQYL